jgi:predicted MPP superfamily phosphohydrolase
MPRFLTRRTLLAGSLAMVGTGAATAGYARYVEPSMRLAVTTYRHEARWPVDFPLTIAALADFHVGEPVMGLDRIEEVVALTNALQPDLIVLLGDYTPRMRSITRLVPLPEAARALARLKAPLGVWSILGNHDWWNDADVQRDRRLLPPVRLALEAAGIPVLENRALRLNKSGRSFWLAGLGDSWAYILPGHRNFAGVDDLPGTLAQLDAHTPAILLAHEPDVFVRVPDRFALTLSGHTHGGQVRIAGWSPVVSSRFGNRFAYGHVVEDGRHLIIVSGGLGCSGMPVRIGVPPEIVLVELGAQSLPGGAA